MTTTLDDPNRWRSLDAALHGFFHSRVADPQARADLVQDVLLRMHERREQLRDEDRLEAWAFRVARNALVDHYRRKRGSEALPELAEHEPEPADRNAEILGAWLRSRIEQLPESYRDARPPRCSACPTPRSSRACNEVAICCTPICSAVARSSSTRAGA
jgi:DNA-directed RNA polymerase specialized sigma24 family protein